MKASPLFIFIIISFLSFSIHAQETIWLDDNLKETTQNKADYYKIGNKLDGEVSYFYKNKNIYRKVFFVDGRAEGNFSEFYNSGELKETGKQENGLRDGIWKTYYKSGKIQSRGKYKDGEKVGIWKTFYKNS
jgi:antitoxin component YwqK of YwqJK toxin-antitoxin module